MEETTPPVQMLASKRVEEYLLSRGDTFAVSRCSDDSIYGDKDYELVWHYSGPNGVTQLGVLVRGDRLMKQSLWFETSYDVEVTPGGSAMMDSAAVYLMYLFLDTSLLYIIPLQEFREWMMMNIDSFPADKIVTKKSIGLHRISSGRFIPLSVVDEFPRVTKIII